MDSFVTIATLDKTHMKHNQMLWTGYVRTSLKAHMLHQIAEPTAIIPDACSLFVVTSDCWGVVQMQFLPDDAMLLL